MATVHSQPLEVSNDQGLPQDVIDHLVEASPAEARQVFRLLAHDEGEAADWHRWMDAHGAQRATRDDLQAI